jgi:hypothetical protein
MAFSHRCSSHSGNPMMALAPPRRNQQVLVLPAVKDQQEESSAKNGEEALWVVGAQEVVVEDGSRDAGARSRSS